MSLASDVRQLMLDARLGRRYARRLIDLSRVGAEQVLTPFWVMFLALIILAAQCFPDQADGRQVTADLARMLDRHPEIGQKLALRTAQALARSLRGEADLFVLIKDELRPGDFALLLCLFADEAALSDSDLGRLLSAAERLAVMAAQHLGSQEMPLDQFNAAITEWMEQLP